MLVKPSVLSERSEIGRSWSHLRRWGGVGAVWLVASLQGCSLQSFDYLRKGEEATGGDSAGAAGTAAGGTVPTSGGSSGGSTRTSTGGSGGTTQTGGSANGGVSSGGTTSAVSLPACGYAPTAGKVLTPPSDGFEVDTSVWSTTSARAGAISRTQSGTDSCVGTWYGTCDGAARTGAWDGPGIELLPYLTPGRQYTVSVAARFTPATAPATAKPIIFSYATGCADGAIATSYRNITQRPSLTNWVRLTGTIQASLTGCTDMNRLVAYVETSEAEATLSIDVDDFQVIELP